ncbi:putative dual-specificity RNA methyltransferase RlmN [Bacteroidia bacterium]|nr:putative dual-specificity RNA methyltransferase RlmN [Bacteroidia bacterium]
MNYLLGKTLGDLEQLAAEQGMPAFAAKQMAQWLYQKRVQDIAAMSNLSLKCRQNLADNYAVGLSAPCAVQQSADGTKKYLLEVAGNPLATIETVYIPSNDRATLCVSSQAGCRMGCTFCATARMGFVQHLSATDILNQILSIPESAMLSNLVLMGMGEPLDNLQAVLQSLQIITAEWGMGWSPTRITLSTIGVHSGLVRFLDETGCHLAVSMHSPFDEERRSLMPMQKAYPIAQTLDIIRRYDWTGQRRVSFEYILFAGINDSPKHALAVARLLQGLECRVNLIRFHALPNSPLRGAGTSTIEQFQQHLQRHGVITTVRTSRGEDILAACGMLATKNREQNA